VIHRRPYRDQQLIAELFCRDDGRLGAVARTSKRRGGSYQALLQPFAPLSVALAGRSSLKTLTQVAMQAPSLALVHQRLYAGLYVNELLYYLLPQQLPMTALFDDYQVCLLSLCRDDLLERPLRRFELQLLTHLGLCPELDRCADGEPLRPGVKYRFIHDAGLVPSAGDGSLSLFDASELQAIAAGALDNAASLQAAKRLCRQALAPYLEGKTLHSRQLFIKSQRGT